MHGINIFIWILKIHLKANCNVGNHYWLWLADHQFFITRVTADKGIYFALVSHFLRKDHHHAFLCTEKHYSDQMNILESKNLAYP